MDAYQQPQVESDEPRTRLSSSNSSENITQQLVSALMKKQNQQNIEGYSEEPSNIAAAEAPEPVSAPSEVSKNIDKTASVSSREQIK